MTLIQKFGKQFDKTIEKGTEKIKEAYQRYFCGVPPQPMKSFEQGKSKQDSASDHPEKKVKDLDQKTLDAAKSAGERVTNNGSPTEGSQPAAPSATESGDNTSSEPHRAITQDKPAYNPTIPTERNQAKARDKGHSL